MPKRTSKKIAKKHTSRVLFLAITALVCFIVIFSLSAATSSTIAASSDCKIPNGGDTDNNGIGDAGVLVGCNYTWVYTYDASGAFYWDKDDRGIIASAGITAVADLDSSTLSVCKDQIRSRGDFNNDPTLNYPYIISGEVSLTSVCRGYDGKGTAHYQIVSQDDPRYTGHPAYKIWETWEYKVITESGSGNFVAKFLHVL